MAAVRPFTFSHVPKLTREQASLSESFRNYVSSRPLQAGFKSSLCEVLRKYLKDEVNISDPELKTVQNEELPSLIPDTGCFILLTAAPSGDHIIIDLDPVLAESITERLLGGDGRADRARRPLTEIEQGVLSFIILKSLAELQEGWTNGRQVALTLSSFAASPSELSATLANSHHHQMVGFRLGLGEQVGYARFFVPDNLVGQAFTVPDQSGATAEELNYMRRLLNSMGEKQVSGRVEAATLELDSEDLNSLEPGDIIIIENHRLNLTPDGPAGSVFVKFGSGQNGGIQGQLINEGGQLRLQITEIVIQEQPLEATMTDSEEQAQHTTEPDDNLPQTEGLLRDIAAPVIVELGRLQMNTAQVIRLKTGQILRLPRGANDPVDLVVNDKLFARGELVEVDGELGIRLVQITGSDAP